MSLFRQMKADKTHMPTTLESNNNKLQITLKITKYIHISTNKQQLAN